MRYRKTSANGDYVFGQNLQDFYIDLDAVVQAINTNIKLLQGEWWEDITDGLPLFQNILAKKLTDGTAGVDLLIRERILKTQGVSNIQTFESTYDRLKRSYSFTATVNTIYGTTTVGSVI